jgi:hypothetical protein
MYFDPKNFKILKPDLLKCHFCESGAFSKMSFKIEQLELFLLKLLPHSL